MLDGMAAVISNTSQYTYVQHASLSLSTHDVQTKNTHTTRLGGGCGPLLGLTPDISDSKYRKYNNKQENITIVMATQHYQ